MIHKYFTHGIIFNTVLKITNTQYSSKMAQEGVVIPSCDWLSPDTWRKRSEYPCPSNWFVNLATCSHDIAIFASGRVSIKYGGKEMAVGKTGKTYNFNISRSSDFVGKFALAILLPSSNRAHDFATKALKEVSLYHKDTIFTLSGEENYRKAAEEGIWPWKTNGNDSRYILIPLMFPGYIHNAATHSTSSKITIQLNTDLCNIFDDIQMMLTGSAVVLTNDLRNQLSTNVINKLNDISIDDFAPNIKYQQSDKCEIMSFINEPLREEYTLHFNNDCKAITVEISCFDPELTSKSLPIKHLEIYFENTLAIHAHAVNAREYYWKLCKLLVPPYNSFILPFSLDLVTPHAASFNFTKIANATLNLNIHPDWKDVKANITIISMGHSPLQM